MGGVSVTHLFKTFKAPGGVIEDHPAPALFDVSLEVADKEFLVIVGPSGCGKSTFLAILAGLVAADRPEQALLDGKPIRGPNAAATMIFQEYALFPWRNVLNNITFGLELRGVPKGERVATGMRYIEMLGLEGFERHFPHQLSGGMRQRVAIGRALANDPDILLMDEPFAALDSLTRRQMQIELLRVWEEDKKTVIFVTHSVPEAMVLGERIVIMSKRPGKIVRIVPVELAYPRDSASSEFRSFERDIYADLEGQPSSVSDQ